MKKIFQHFYAIVFAIVLFMAAIAYMNYKDNDYNSIIEKAAKLQRDNSEFIDFYGEIEPAFPDKNLNAQTIAGIDENKNGIRDDIDIWINRFALNKNETLAMRQYAKAKQNWLINCETATDKAEDCLTHISDYQRKESGYAKKMLDFLILNTNPRKKCEVSTPKKATLPESKNFHCDFEIQYYENVVFGNNEWKQGR
jgi:hypothetical protein